MSLHDILRSGYTFTPQEYELETRYVMTNAALLLIALILFPVSILYYLTDGTQNALTHFSALPLSLLTMYLARKVGKGNYTRLLYVISLFFMGIIFYSYYKLPELYPVSSWIIIMIIASF